MDYVFAAAALREQGISALADPSHAAAITDMFNYHVQFYGLDYAMWNLQTLIPAV